jgi:hypothetical protein
VSEPRNLVCYKCGLAAARSWVVGFVTGVGPAHAGEVVGEHVRAFGGEGQVTTKVPAAAVAVLGWVEREIGEVVGRWFCGFGFHRGVGSGRVVSMTRRRKWMLVAVCALVACVVVAMLARESEPSYGGKRLSDWVAVHGLGTRVRDEHVFASVADRELAADAIRHIGTNAFPWLFAWMDCEPAAWRYKVGPTFQKLPAWIRHSPPWLWLIGRDKANERSQNAGRAFAALGPMAAPVVPELTRRINQTNSTFRRNVALIALSSLGPLAVPTMRSVLSNPERAGDLWVMECIRNMGTNARPLVPLLVQNVQHTNWFAAGENVRMLGHLKMEPELVVPALTKGLKDVRYEVRRQIADALREFGQLARPSVPALLEALNDSDLDARRNATNALMRIAPEVLTNAPGR